MHQPSFTSACLCRAGMEVDLTCAGLSRFTTTQADTIVCIENREIYCFKDSLWICPYDAAVCIRGDEGSARIRTSPISLPQLEGFPRIQRLRFSTGNTYMLISYRKNLHRVLFKAMQRLMETKAICCMENLAEVLARATMLPERVLAHNSFKKANV